MSISDLYQNGYVPEEKRVFKQDPAVLEGYQYDHDRLNDELHVARKYDTDGALRVALVSGGIENVIYLTRDQVQALAFSLTRA